MGWDRARMDQDEAGVLTLSFRPLLGQRHEVPQIVRDKGASLAYRRSKLLGVV